VPTAVKKQTTIEPALNTIPKPSEIKGVIVAPENKVNIPAKTVMPAK